MKYTPGQAIFGKHVRISNLLTQRINHSKVYMFMLKQAQAAIKAIASRYQQLTTEGRVFYFRLYPTTLRGMLLSLLDIDTLPPTHNPHTKYP